MSRESPAYIKKFMEELKKRNGGIDFQKDPPSRREMYECVKRIGCVSLPDIAQERRKIRVRSKENG